jgi:hypothetical protein
LLFSIIILGITVSLIKGQDYPSAVPSQTSYAAFCGGWGILIALIGVAALFAEALQGIIIAGLDGLTALLMLAGGIVSSPSPKLRGIHSTTSASKLYLDRKRKPLTIVFNKDLLGNTRCE